MIFNLTDEETKILLNLISKRKIAIYKILNSKNKKDEVSLEEQRQLIVERKRLGDVAKTLAFQRASNVWEDFQAQLKRGAE